MCRLSSLLLIYLYLPLTTQFASLAPPSRRWRLPIQRRRGPVHSPKSPFLAASEKPDDDHYDGSSSSSGDLSDEFIDVSDEVTLLAAQAYLKRRKKLPWKAKEARQRRREARPEGTGYFWHDPSDLPKIGDIDDITGYPGSAAGDPANVNSGASARLSRSQRSASDLDSHLDDSESESVDPLYTFDLSGENQKYQTYFGLPDPYERSRLVRKQSIAKKKKFADPEWKKKWYAARWGEGYVPKSKQRELQKRVGAVPLDVLQSPELAGLTDEEVNEAVRVYLAANDKRGKKTAERHQFGYSDWHKKRNEDAKSMAESYETDVKSPDAQAKAAQERSTRARKAYRTRLENAAAKDNEPTAPWQEGGTIQR
eukprot:CAMPEP_0182479506 /NCGR_PEP_ID=MMETSP1319-20130603/34307_1 /TAXON_ID=172717 /ORGANISM="Bolidomonas pacifica, Strain RCC208" /LENGTH=367 /DNA_ID=CAMNT_0024680933 /DNA_START=83 /DNA_END=1183 /DNA_ORIENTATION=+